MTTRRMAVVDYGVNNVGSVVNMLRRLEVEVDTAKTGEELSRAQAILLPGIGSFDTGVVNLKRAGLFDALRDRASAGVPLLGICLGMQLLTRGSEEGTKEGLGLVAATTKRFRFETGHEERVPHMGWNEVTVRDRDLFAGFEGEAPRFYFVHSFHVVCDDERDVAATCRYGIDFTAALRHGLVFGTQFHPEKSHRFGMRVLESFCRIALHG